MRAWGQSSPNASTGCGALGRILAYACGWHCAALAVIMIGVVEEVRECATPDDVLRFVSRRTVYTVAEIERMSKEGQIHAMLFRQDRMLPKR